MTIRKARLDELDKLDRIYNQARDYMHTHGNPNQWIQGYPNKTDIKNDIECGCLFVLDICETIEAVFFYYDGEDSTYDYIENGNWLNDEPYAVVHRVASAMNRKRMGDVVIQYCQDLKNNIRIDTHEDNKAMQRMLERNGFQHVGTIYLKDGSARRAYHWCKHCNMNEN